MNGGGEYTSRSRELSVYQMDHEHSIDCRPACWRWSTDGQRWPTHAHEEIKSQKLWTAEVPSSSFSCSRFRSGLTGRVSFNRAQ